MPLTHYLVYNVYCVLGIAKSSDPRLMMTARISPSGNLFFYVKQV